VVKYIESQQIVIVAPSEEGMSDIDGYLDFSSNTKPGPEGNLVIAVLASAPSLDKRGRIKKTGINLGDSKGDDISSLLEILREAKVPLESFRSVSLMTCYGAIRGTAQTQSLAQSLSQALQIPVVASEGRIAIMAVPLNVLDLPAVEEAPDAIPVLPIFFSLLMPSGATRESPWKIIREGKQKTDGEHDLSLTDFIESLDSMQSIGALLGKIPGDVRPYPGLNDNFPSLLALAPGHSIRPLRKEWGSLGVNLNHRKILGIVAAAPPMSDPKLLEEVIDQVVADLPALNGIALISIYPSWFPANRRAYPQTLANTLRLPVFAPTPPEDGGETPWLERPLEEWLRNINYKKWKVYRPRVTELTLYDDELQMVVAELDEKFSRRSAPFVKNLLETAYRTKRLPCGLEVVKTLLGMKRE